MDFKKWEFNNGKAKRIICGDLVLELDGFGDIFWFYLTFNMDSGYCRREENYLKIDIKPLNTIYYLRCINYYFAPAKILGYSKIKKAL